MLCLLKVQLNSDIPIPAVSLPLLVSKDSWVLDLMFYCHDNLKDDSIVEKMSATFYCKSALLAQYMMKILKPVYDKIDVDCSSLVISPVSIASVFNETESKALQKLRKFLLYYSGVGHFSGFEYSHVE